MKTAAYDYIIVGAGTAGCVLANRLSEDPAVSVLLLEAGGRDLDPLIHIPIGFGIMRERRMHDWRYDSEPEPGLGGRRIAVHRGKVLGGSSSINVQVWTRGDRRDFERWARQGAHGWSYEDVLPYFKRSERWQDGESAVRGGHGPVAVRWSGLDDPLYDAWRRAAARLGHRVDHDMNAGDVEGFGRVQFNIGRGRRVSSAAAYLRPVMSRRNLRVVTRALVQRIVLDGSRAVGVEYAAGGSSITARAMREVILSAGSFNTPQVLMLSGIGPSSKLRQLGIAPVLDLPVGENLRDHWSVPNFHARRSPGHFHRHMRADRMAMSMLRAFAFGTGPATHVPTHLLGFVKSEPGLDVPDLEFLMPPTAPNARLWFPGLRLPYGDSFGTRPAIMHARSRGVVSLRSANPADPPRILFNALQEPEDVAVLARGIRMSRELAMQPDMDAFRGPELLPPPDVRSDSELETFIRQTAMPVYHPASTCAIGAVVDHELKVMGTEGLRVVDASAMPDLVTGHINACVTMMAEKASDMILGRSPLRA